MNCDFQPGELVIRTVNDPCDHHKKGTMGLLIANTNSSYYIWKVLVGPEGNIAEWSAYNFKRVFDNEQQHSNVRRGRASA